MPIRRIDFEYAKCHFENFGKNFYHPSTSARSYCSPIFVKLPLSWIARTDEELSIVCDASVEISNGEKSEGWSCFKVLGPLDFALTGILAKISSTLTSISIFAISTYYTDYILVKSNLMKEAKVVLETNGYLII